jgi:hypothetical protein
MPSRRNAEQSVLSPCVSFRLDRAIVVGSGPAPIALGALCRLDRLGRIAVALITTSGIVIVLLGQHTGRKVELECALIRMSVSEPTPITNPPSRRGRLRTVSVDESQAPVNAPRTSARSSLRTGMALEGSNCVKRMTTMSSTGLTQKKVPAAPPQP